MKLWLCAFANGDRAIVHAESADDAIQRLDEVAEIGAADPPPHVVEFQPENFFVFFYPSTSLDGPDEDPCWLVDSQYVAEATWRALGNAKPALAQRERQCWTEERRTLHCTKCGSPQRDYQPACPKGGDHTYKGAP